MKKIKMLAIDLGASSGRGIIGTFDGEKITLEENHRFTNEPVMVAGQSSAFCTRSKPRSANAQTARTETSRPSVSTPGALTSASLTKRAICSQTPCITVTSVR